MFQFGRKSKLQIATAHQDWQLILSTAIMVTEVDFGVAEAHRSKTLQLQYFNEGRTECDGINILSKHNYYPSLAVDIYPYVNGKAKWVTADLSYLAGIIKAVSEMLYAQGKITHKVRWGGNWDKDGEILTDQQFDDMPHMELYKPAA
jgi:peptidoglycan L-alanyl-D-glutamate endopeptidase CwlK